MKIKLIICTDIYGETPFILKLAQAYKQQGMNVSIISPYNQPHEAMIHTATHESAIYQMFITQCGHEAYLNKVLNTLLSEPENKKIIVLGFSAGASAAWRALSSNRFTGTTGRKTVHLIGFYPSQIRHYLKQVPQCTTSLIFPIKEPHFDVSLVVQALTDNSNISCIKTPWLHGFLNPHSTNFSSLAYHLIVPLLTDLGLLTEPTKFSTDLRNLFLD